MTFQKKWHDIVVKKQTLLCVGLDPAEPAQRPNAELSSTNDKLAWSLALVKNVAAHAAAIKLNRNYYKDFSRSDMQKLVSTIHNHNMLAIDDSKIADIGTTIDAGLFHAKEEGFDAVTFAPFAGNSLEAAQSAEKHNVALISLVLMSNPEFQSTKNAMFGKQKGYEFFAHEAMCHPCIAGVVIGAPSEKNHISTDEVEHVQKIIQDKLVLMPGIGAQGGEIDFMKKTFSKKLIVNVGRAIFQSPNPQQAAKEFRDLSWPHS